jgi:hypothetical protein
LRPEISFLPELGDVVAQQETVFQKRLSILGLSAPGEVRFLLVPSSKGCFGRGVVTLHVLSIAERSVGGGTPLLHVALARALDHRAAHTQMHAFRGVNIEHAAGHDALLVDAAAPT